MILSEESMSFKCQKSQAPPSHKRAIWSEDVRVALAVHVLSVAFDAVAAVDLSERRRHVGGRAEEVGVGEGSSKLHPLLIPVSPQNALNLQEGTQRGCKKAGRVTGQSQIKEKQTVQLCLA